MLEHPTRKTKQFLDPCLPDFLVMAFFFSKASAILVMRSSIFMGFSR